MGPNDGDVVMRRKQMLGEPLIGRILGTGARRVQLETLISDKDSLRILMFRQDKTSLVSKMTIDFRVLRDANKKDCVGYSVKV